MPGFGEKAVLDCDKGVEEPVSHARGPEGFSCVTLMLIKISLSLSVCSSHGTGAGAPPAVEGNSKVDHCSMCI
jgi:hypothetical protein